MQMKGISVKSETDSLQITSIRQVFSTPTAEG